MAGKLFRIKFTDPTNRVYCYSNDIQISIMERPEGTFFAKAYNPITQAAVVLCLALIIMIGGKLMGASGVLEVSERFPWMTAAAFLLFFSMFNSIFSLSSKNMNTYWGRSIMSYAALVLIMGGLAYLFSSISINEAGSYRWIMIILTFGYLVFMSIVRFMKSIVEFAEKEEWTKPKPRRRRKK